MTDPLTPADTRAADLHHAAERIEQGFPVDADLRGEVARLVRAHAQGRATTIARLLSALERTEHNLSLAIMGKPVRDMCENLAENEAARAASATREGR